MNINEKRILIQKSKFEQVNKIKLDSVLNRIDTRFNEVKVVSNNNYKIIIITPKIERV